MNVLGADLNRLTREAVEGLRMDLFTGANFIDLRREAAYELLRRDCPEEYRAWKQGTWDGLTFDPDEFLDSVFLVEEVKLGDDVMLLVAGQGFGVASRSLPQAKPK